MTQRELCLAIAETTGDSVRLIRQHGFSLVTPYHLVTDDISDDSPQVVDWDRVELERIADAIQA
jgi:hypothetical protein